MESLKRVNATLSVLSAIALASWLVVAVYSNDLKWQYAMMSFIVGLYAGSAVWMKLHERYRNAANEVIMLQSEIIGQCAAALEDPDK